MRIRSWVALLLVAAAPSVGCKRADPLESGVQVSFATHNPAATLAPVIAGAPAGDTIPSGADTLIIDRAEIILRKIELKRAEDAVCQSGSGGCPEVEIGPLLVDLPLGGATQQKITAQVPEGTYNRVDFEIHKLTGDQQDAALRQQRPDLLDRSIKVQGKYNGAAFVYETDLDVEQEIAVAPPLVAGGSVATNLTMRVVLADWFRDAAGALVDPVTGNKGGVNESIIKENIKRSMKAFEDRDHDGREG